MGFTVNVSLLPIQSGVEVQLWLGVNEPDLLAATAKTDAEGQCGFGGGSSYYPLNVQVKAPSLGVESTVKQVNEGSVISLVLESAPPPPPYEPPEGLDYRKLVVPACVMLIGAWMAR